MRDVLHWVKKPALRRAGPKIEIRLQAFPHEEHISVTLP